MTPTFRAADGTFDSGATETIILQLARHDLCAAVRHSVADRRHRHHLFDRQHLPDDPVDKRDARYLSALHQPASQRAAHHQDAAHHDRRAGPGRLPGLDLLRVDSGHGPVRLHHGGRGGDARPCWRHSSGNGSPRSVERSRWRRGWSPVCFSRPSISSAMESINLGFTVMPLDYEYAIYPAGFASFPRSDRRQPADTGLARGEVEAVLLGLLATSPGKTHRVVEVVVRRLLGLVRGPGFAVVGVFAGRSWAA